jgi:lipopolysaccharide biosynthesis regulator YciM
LEALAFLFFLLVAAYGVGWLMGRRRGDRQGAQKYYVMGYDAGVNYAIEKLYAGKVRYEERAG